MLNFLLIVLCVIVLTLNFLKDVLLREHHKKKLQERFATWWLQVEYQSKLDIALACASLSDKLLNYIFGEKLLVSTKVWMRSFMFATCLLVTTLAMVGLLQKQTYVITPWQNYKDSVDIVTTTIDKLFSQKEMDYFRQVSLTGLTNPAPFYKDSNAFVLTINSNYFLVKVQTNAIKEITQMTPLGHGSMTVYYNRVLAPDATHATNGNVGVTSNDVNNTINELAKEARGVQRFAVKHSTNQDVVLYSVVYFVSLILLNTILFLLSQATCRGMLREMVKARTVAATASLLTTNVTVVFFLSLVSVAFFALLALPIFWFFIPFVYYWYQESIYTSLMMCVAGSVEMWIMSSVSIKVIVLIAFIPSAFACVVGLFSLIAMKWRGMFYFIVKEILIRCAEQNPVVVFIATFVFISGLLAIAAKFLHITAFL